METLCRCDIIDVDVTKSLVRSYAGVVLATGDSNANKYGVNVYKAGEPLDMTGYSVLGYFIRPDMATLPVTGAVEGNTAYVYLPAACYAYEGSFSLAIKISGAEITQTVRVVDGHIRQTQTDTIVDPGEVIPSLDDLFAQIAVIESATEASKAATAEANETIVEMRRTVADALESTADAIAQAGTAVLKSASGALITIDDAAERPLRKAVSDIVAVQEGKGDPSPDNIRPISGWDAVKLTRTGRNLIRYPYYSAAESMTKNGVTFTVGTDGGVTANGTATARTSFMLRYITAGEEIHLVQGQKYTISGCPEGGSESTYHLLVQDVNYKQTVKEVGAGITFEPNYNDYYVAIRVESGVTVENLVFRPMLAVGDAAMDFEPYQGVELDAALPETVYGGRLDWGTGVLTVDRKKIVVDGSEPWEKNVLGVFQFQNIEKLTGYKKNGITPLCDTYGKFKWTATSGVLEDKSFGMFNTQTNKLELLWINDSSYDTVNDLVAALQANPVTVIFELEKPYTIQLTPQQLDMLAGYNAVWRDAGDTHLTYVADTKSYIDDSVRGSVLTGKIVTFNGDSICAKNGGYGAIIAQEHGMIYENVGVNGGTIKAETYTDEGVARHWICRTIESMRADADYIILEGGVNDGSANMGALSEGYEAELDDTTFYGAFESMLKQALNRWPGKKIGYIFVHKCSDAFSSSSADTKPYYAAMACLKKWGIPYLDLNTECPPLRYIESLRTAYTIDGDGWHPNDDGYRAYYVPKIEAWMMGL